MSEVELIDAVVNTLDQVQVSGRDNMDKLLACINALEGLKKVFTEGGETDG